MIDIHTHILPGIDDGAKTIEDSIRMARTASEGGVQSLFVTPHCNVEGVFDNYYNDKLRERFLELEDKLKQEQIPLQIMLGMEVYGTEEVPFLLHKRKLIGLNQSRYLLIEFDFRKDLSLIDYLISEITSQGFLPIIAHPERYPYVQKNPVLVYQWLEQGCSLQVNKGSVMGGFGSHAKRTALYLLECKLASFIASDAHSPEMRTTDLSKVYEFIDANYSKEYTRILFEENPKRIIMDQDLVPLHSCKS